MAGSLAITQRQARSLMRAAEAERGIIEMVLEGVTIRLIPKCHSESLSKPLDVIRSDEPFNSLDEYKAWRDRSRDHRD